MHGIIIECGAHCQVMKNLLVYSLNSDHHYSVYKPCERQHTLAYANHQPWDFWLFYWLLKSLSKYYRRKTSKNSIVLKKDKRNLLAEGQTICMWPSNLSLKNAAFVRPADPKHFKKSLCSTKHLCPIVIFQMQK